MFVRNSGTVPPVNSRHQRVGVDMEGDLEGDLEEREAHNLRRLTSGSTFIVEKERLKLHTGLICGVGGKSGTLRRAAFCNSQSANCKRLSDSSESLRRLSSGCRSKLGAIRDSVTQREQEEAISVAGRTKRFGWAREEEGSRGRRDKATARDRAVHFPNSGGDKVKRCMKTKGESGRGSEGDLVGAKGDGQSGRRTERRRRSVERGAAWVVIKVGGGGQICACGGRDEQGSLDRIFIAVRAGSVIAGYASDGLLAGISRGCSAAWLAQQQGWGLCRRDEHKRTKMGEKTEQLWCGKGQASRRKEGFSRGEDLDAGDPIGETEANASQIGKEQMTQVRVTAEATRTKDYATSRKKTDVGRSRQGMGGIR
ncbi:hypothetical protein C8F01DRAFT_1087037 [Mycena amicta]|nr:hypothetical protein C8F01DRAFT_1087037 [Mycena amicta]